MNVFLKKAESVSVEADLIPFQQPIFEPVVYIIHSNAASGSASKTGGRFGRVLLILRTDFINRRFNIGALLH